MVFNHMRHMMKVWATIKIPTPCTNFFVWLYVLEIWCQRRYLARRRDSSDGNGRKPTALDNVTRILQVHQYYIKVSRQNFFKNYIFLTYLRVLKIDHWGYPLPSVLKFLFWIHNNFHVHSKICKSDLSMPNQPFSSQSWILKNCVDQGVIPKSVFSFEDLVNWYSQPL